jgi:hypothetical protein
MVQHEPLWMRITRQEGRKSFCDRGWLGAFWKFASSGGVERPSRRERCLSDSDISEWGLQVCYLIDLPPPAIIYSSHSVGLHRGDNFCTLWHQTEPYQTFHGSTPPFEFTWRKHVAESCLWNKARNKHAAWAENQKQWNSGLRYTTTCWCSTNATYRRTRAVVPPIKSSILLPSELVERWPSSRLALNNNNYSLQESVLRKANLVS